MEKCLGDDSIFAWHWLTEDLRAGSGDEPPWSDGEERTFEGNITLCEAGYHHSPTPFDGLEYAPGPVLCRVEVSWPFEVDETKGVSRTRRLLAHRDVSRELRLFACDSAERALLWERAAGQEPDVHSWQAVEVARRFAVGEATREELKAARTAAKLAASVAESVAKASSVASVAEASSVASAKAACASSWAASWAAAESAAWESAESAACASSWAVGVEERARQRKRFNAVMMGLFEEGVK